MFLTETHLPQLLSPETYFDPEWYRHERERVLRTAWWAVATLDEFRRDGDYITFDHVDGPVILWRKGGEIRAFRNVCAHRLAKLTGKRQGHGACLTCDYHGWEYDESGATRKIPDASAFRPLEKGRLGLDAVKAAVVGSVVFMSFDADAPPIQEWLGDEAERLANRFCSSSRTLWKAEIDIPVNWKLLIENNLESYHVASVHGKTLGSFPEEAACEHDFSAARSRFTGPGSASAWGKVRLALAQQIRGGVPGVYTHSLVYPAFTWLCVDLMSGFQSIVPTGPRSCRMIARFATIQSDRGNSIVDWVARLCVAGELKFWRRVIKEDVALLPQVQAGIESPRHPGVGLISRREERLVHFQRWLLEQMQQHDADATADASARRGGAA